MRTKAVRDGDDWVLNGTKCWMSGVVQADWYCVFAKTGPAD
jgi:alkylation response protein AidB-like acyl-CoA dehydrogenase